jgi:hypothetical protein
MLKGLQSGTNGNFHVLLLFLGSYSIPMCIKFKEICEISGLQLDHLANLHAIPFVCAILGFVFLLDQKLSFNSHQGCVRRTNWGHSHKFQMKLLLSAENADTFICATSEDLKATSHTRLRAHDHCTTRTLIGGKGKAGPSSLHTALEGPMEYVNTRWM